MMGSDMVPIKIGRELETQVIEIRPSSQGSWEDPKARASGTKVNSMTKTKS